MATILTFDVNSKKETKEETGTISMAAVKKVMMKDGDPNLSLSLIEPDPPDEKHNHHHHHHHSTKRKVQAPSKYLTEMTKHELCSNKSGQSIKLMPYLFRFSATQIRVFHITWITFFVCFFSWFSVTNLDLWMSDDLGLTLQDKSIAKGLQSFSTIIFRIIFGDLCDKIGARYSYIILLMVSLVSLLCMAFVTHDSVSYIILSVLMGVIGASFVITEYHVTAFFSQNCVGVANALAAGWGNFGGGVTMAITPLVCNLFINRLNIAPQMAWRFTLLLPCALLAIMTVIYYLYTIDTPKGNISKEHITARIWCTFNKYKWKRILCDYRVWLLSLSYALCFGIEITVLNYCVEYFVYQFGIASTSAGWMVFAFSFLNLFARGFGGYLSDILSAKYGLQGKVYCLFLVLLFEALFLFLFAFSSFHFGYSVLMMLFFSCYVQIAEGIV
eukprot:304031_1